MHHLKFTLPGVFLLFSLPLSAQKSQLSKRAYEPDSLGSFVLAVNPVHVFFGHTTFYAEFMNRRGKNSFRSVLSFGINDNEERYNWAAGFHFKRFQPGHYYRSAAYVGVGVLGASISAGFDDAFMFEPQFVGGWQFSPGKAFNLSLEAGVGISIPTSSGVALEKPVNFLLGLILGLRL